ncbi:two-component system sensor histidine kinase TcrY [Okibacterium endophyticum]
MTGVSLLVGVVFVITSIVTVLALRSSVMERLDEQVLDTLNVAFDPHDGAPDGDERGPQPRIGSLQVVFDSEGSVLSSAYVADDGTEVSLTAAQLGVLRDQHVEERRPVTVDLGGDLGAFRVASASRGGDTVIAGNSLDDVAATTGALALILAGVMAVALLAAIVGAVLFITRALRPLKRVASTAERVAQRPLAAGEVRMPERVAEEDTDPDTEVGRVGSSLNTLLGHVQSALVSRQNSEEQLRRFIADASHELRTPLASIRGYAELSRRENAPMTTTQERSLERISAEAVRMSSLVEDLLLLARLDAGQHLRRDPVDLTMLTIDSVSDAHAADPTHEWLLDLDEQIEVPGDENRLRQVVVNLLANARMHTPAGTTVVAEVSHDDDHAVLRVVDDGPGIHPDTQERLFQRFARGDSSRNRDAGSTGLGLSISRAIVEAHGGRITAESRPGRTVFTVMLPLERRDDTAA